MAVFKVRTRGGSSPKGKPRVYFSCHFADFSRFFDKICEDVFAQFDCAIYYTEDMDSPLDELTRDTDLGQMNLFLVPVTYRLLSESCRAMKEDIPFAIERHIPILPFMMEQGLDAVYASSEIFGGRQYVSPFSEDSTAIRYEDKLKRYLDSVLVSAELAARIRAAFDAYIFLSYRKKDRAYANRLMRLIHDIPGCRDIAIWYDEFLTPGESFTENIERAMRQSSMFTLLVTPNILEEDNFVMREEYPAAKRSGMSIFPAEMERTDHRLLREKFYELPDCFDPEDQHFGESFVNALKRIAVTENDHDREHNFLVGLAYLDGIDVEVDTDRGIRLITMAAEAGLMEAMDKLYNMYTNGIGVRINYALAEKWAGRIAAFAEFDLGDDDPTTLIYLNNMALAMLNQGKYREALPIQQRVYDIQCIKLGNEDISSLISLSNLGLIHHNLGDYPKAIEQNKRAYESLLRCFGEECPVTITALNNLAVSYFDSAQYSLALEYNKKAYEISCRVRGEEHLETLIALSAMAATLRMLGDFQSNNRLMEKAHSLLLKNYGEYHPATANSLTLLGISYADLGDYKHAIELSESAFNISVELLGKDHPKTMQSLYSLAMIYGSIGDYRTALDMMERVYESNCRSIGEEHHDTLMTLNNVAYCCDAIGDHDRAIELHEKAYYIRRRLYGEGHFDTVLSVSNLALARFHRGDYQHSLALFEWAYARFAESLGEGHQQTIQTKNYIDEVRRFIK